MNAKKTFTLREASLIFGVLVTSVLATPSAAQESPMILAAKEFALTGQQVAALVGKSATVELHTGKTLQATIKAMLASRRQKDRVRFVNVQVEGEARPKRLQAKLIKRLQVDGNDYELRPIGGGVYFVEDVERRKTAIAERLAKKRARLWEPYTEKQQAEFVKKQKEFLEQVKSTYGNLPLKLHETKYFLFLSDMPRKQVIGYIRKLDQMNERMGQAFGIQPGRNIWRGKAAVLAFVDRRNFIDFEGRFMNNPATGSAQGICHSRSDGDVLVACFRGNDPSYFGVVLVHETAHGYVHRHISSVRIPSWLNEGIADWIANIAVPGDSAVERRQLKAAQMVKRAGSLGRLFDADRIQSWQYGVSSSIVDILVRKNDRQFRLLIDGIKEGLTFEQSLKRSYGSTPNELIIAYGRSIRVPNLTP